MCSPDRRLGSIGWLSTSSAIVLVVLAAVTTASQAATRGGGMSMGSRGSMMSSRSAIRGSEPGFQKFKTMSSDGVMSRRLQGKLNRGQGKVVYKRA